MKKVWKKGLILVLCLALMVPQVFASDALGSGLKGRTVQLGSGTLVTESSLWSATYSDLRTEHYITYAPNRTVTPMVWYSGTAASTGRLTAGAEQLAQQGYRVVAGINGGFFNTDGTPVGMLLTDGVIRCLDQWNYQMVGFCADGTVFIDSSDVTKTVSWGSLFGGQTSLELTAVNGSRKNGGLYLFTEDFGTSMKNTLGGVDVVLEPVMPGQSLRMNSTVTLRVVRVTDSTTEGVQPDNTIPAGGFVLSANLNCDASMLDALRSLTPGTQVTVDISGGDSRWANAVYGLTGLYSLVENGQVVSGLQTGAAPRTALGVKNDGTVVLYTIDGRQNGYSIGASYTQVAQRLIELGCVRAVALDGGGSTTLGATLPGSSGFTVLNKPSGGSQRAVNNCIMLVTTAPSYGMLDSFYVEAANDVVLTGSRTTVSALAADANGYPANFGGSLSWTSSGGAFSVDEAGNTVFTVGMQPGTFDVTATAMGRSGSAPIRVVDRLSRLTVTRRDGGDAATLLLSPGDMVQLDAAGSWYNLPVSMDAASVVWTAEGAIGEIDPTGLFLAGAENAQGTITASAGGQTVTIQVRVDRGDPFTDITGHWSQEYVTRLYKMGLTTGTLQPDGTYVYEPDGSLTRGQLLVFVSRMLGVDTSLYEGVELPFADLDSIDEWMLPHVKAMYALRVFGGSNESGVLYAYVNQRVTREAAMTMLGRTLAQQQSCDLSVFADAGKVSSWASPYVQTLVSQGIVNGSGGYLNPQSHMTRGEIAKVLTLVSALPRA